MVPVTTWSSERSSSDGNRGCLLSVGAILGSLTTLSTLALPTLALGLPVSVSHVFFHVLSTSSGSSGVVPGRCPFKALAFALVTSCPLRLGLLATLPSLDKLGLSSKLFSDLLTVLNDLGRDTFNDGTNSLAALSSEVLLGELFDHVRHTGGNLAPFGHDDIFILHNTSLPRWP
jgi:hypothetical protein